MKQVKKALTVFTFGIALLCNTNLLAQQWSPVTQSDVNTVVQEMDDLYGDIIEIDNSVITNFLQTLLNGSLPAGCAPPAASIDTYTTNAIRFEWSPISGAGKYRIGFLNLQSGSHGQENYNPAPNDIYQLTNVPDGLYLFAFQSFCGPKPGALSITIADKDIMLITGSTSSCNCRSVEEQYPIVMTVVLYITRQWRHFCGQPAHTTPVCLHNVPMFT